MSEKQITGEVANTSHRKGWPVPGDDEILIATVGGIGEIGMNMTLYGHAGKWLLVDAGVAFTKPEEKERTGRSSKSVSFNSIRHIAPDIVGAVITHAHEDHIGGLQDLWPQYLNCPIFTTPFAGEILRLKGDVDADFRTFEPGSDLDFPELEPFKISSIEMTHSVPEPVALMISGKGCERTIFHSGDWKFDDNPIFGGYDKNRLKQIGYDGGVDVLLSDSTNSVKDHVEYKSEADVGKALDAIMQDATGMVVVCCFASNVDRLVNIASKAQLNNRSVAFAGRSMRTFIEVADGMDMLGDLNNIVNNPADLDYIPGDKKVLVCTGIQGEERAVLARLANSGMDTAGRLPELRAGDTVVLSGRTIPGNEQYIDPILATLREKGVKIIKSNERINGYPVHVSGHASGDEIRELYDMVKPKTVMPVHGESVHLLANGRIANECGANCMFTLPGAVVSLRKSGNLKHVSTVNVTEHYRYDNEILRNIKARERSSGSRYRAPSF